MSDQRQFIVRFDRRHDAAAIARIEQQPSMSEYIRELVRRDTSDENARLRELVVELWDTALHPNTFGDGSYLMERMRELGVDA